MPPQTPQVDPFAEFVVSTDDPFAQFAAQAAPPEAAPQGTTWMPEAITGVRHGVPAGIRTVGEFAANHPGGIQRVIAAGSSALGGTLGGAIGAGLGGGTTGGVIGAMAGATASRGLTPTQQTIREMAGRMKGESRDVAKAAGRAVGIQEYIKNTSGYKVNPSDILERPHGLPAAKSYAKSQGREVLEILDADGNVARGPTAPATPKAPSAGGRLLTGAKQGAGYLGRGLAAISGPMAMTDFAQAVEPDRRDIGVMGIGRSVDVPGAHPPALNQLRDYIMAKLGLQ